MAKQTINIGSTANDGTGSTLRVGGDIINDNFNEIYTAFGDGSTLTAPLTAAVAVPPSATEDVASGITPPLENAAAVIVFVDCVNSSVCAVPVLAEGVCPPNDMADVAVPTPPC